MKWKTETQRVNTEEREKKSVGDYSFSLEQVSPEEYFVFEEGRKEKEKKKRGEEREKERENETIWVTYKFNI